MFNRRKNIVSRKAVQRRVKIISKINNKSYNYYASPKYVESFNNRRNFSNSNDINNHPNNSNSDEPQNEEHFGNEGYYTCSDSESSDSDYSEIDYDEQPVMDLQRKDNLVSESLLHFVTISDPEVNQEVWDFLQQFLIYNFIIYLFLCKILF